MNTYDAFARFYDADLGAHTADLPFWRELAQRAEGPVLELMCGTGRVLVPLARSGQAVTGVDVSPQLLSIAQRNVERAGVEALVTLRLADARTFTAEQPYVLAFVALNSFMHLTETADQLAVLQRAHAALAADGLLALDLFNPDPRELGRHGGELVYDRTFALADGTQVQKFIAQTVDFAAQTASVTFFYDELSADGTLRRTAVPFPMRWLYRYEVEHPLARAGFAIEVIYGGYDLEPHTSESPQLLVVARKI